MYLSQKTFSLTSENCETDSWQAWIILRSVSNKLSLPEKVHVAFETKPILIQDALCLPLPHQNPHTFHQPYRVCPADFNSGMYSVVRVAWWLKGRSCPWGAELFEVSMTSFTYLSYSHFLHYLNFPPVVSLSGSKQLENAMENLCDSDSLLSKLSVSLINSFLLCNMYGVYPFLYVNCILFLYHKYLIALLTLQGPESQL